MAVFNGMAVLNGLASESGQDRSFRSLLDCAREADVEKPVPEMQHFSRWVFAQARACGVAGDPIAAGDLLSLASEAAGGSTVAMRGYYFLAQLIGWRSSARALEFGRSLTGRRAGPETIRQLWMS